MQILDGNEDSCGSIKWPDLIIIDYFSFYYRVFDIIIGVIGILFGLTFIICSLLINNINYSVKIKSIWIYLPYLLTVIKVIFLNVCLQINLLNIF